MSNLSLVKNVQMEYIVDRLAGSCNGLRQHVTVHNRERLDQGSSYEALWRRICGLLLPDIESLTSCGRFVVWTV